MAIATNVLADRRDMPASFLRSECLEGIGKEWLRRAPYPAVWTPRRDHHAPGLQSRAANAAS